MYIYILLEKNCNYFLFSDHTVIYNNIYKSEIYLIYYFIHKIYIYIDIIWSVAFSADGKFLASGSQDETVNLVEIQS